MLDRLKCPKITRRIYLGYILSNKRVTNDGIPILKHCNQIKNSPKFIPWITTVRNLKSKKNRLAFI